MKKIKTTASVVIRVFLWALMLFGGTGISLYLDSLHFRQLFSSVWFHVLTLPVGLSLLKLSFHAAATGGRQLAKYGRQGDVVHLETNRLVTSGVYQCTRHPMLFGLMFFPLALALVIGSPTFILIVAPLEMLFIAFMVLVLEEAECRKKFGNDYERYAAEVPVFPKTIACLKRVFCG